MIEHRFLAREKNETIEALGKVCGADSGEDDTIEREVKRLKV